MENHVSPEQISALVDQQLSEREARAARLHLEQCGICRALHDEISEVTHLFQNIAAVEPSPFLWRRISARITPLPAQASRKWLSGFGFSKPAWAGAGLMIALLAAFVLTVEHRSLQLARQEALDEIEAVRLAMNGPDPEISNPFRAMLTVDQNPNPFSVKRLSVESNPFRLVAVR